MRNCSAPAGNKIHAKTCSFSRLPELDSLLSRKLCRMQRRQQLLPLAAAKFKAQHVDANQSDAVKKAIRLAEGRKTRPVNADEAAKGKLDFVQVKEWGSGEPSDLDSLQINSYTSNVVDDDQPFYVCLARQLELLEAKGALHAARPQDSRPLPPFERWSMKAPHYVQFLVDLLHVHRALEAALASAPATAARKQYDAQEGCKQALSALQHFSGDVGMHRCREMEADLAAIAACSWLPDVQSVQPSGHALALGQALHTLQNTSSRSDARGWLKAALRLIAFSYCIYVTNLSMGARIGSAAAEKLNLFKANAINTWRSFPEMVGRNPVVTFAEHVNAAGQALDKKHRQTVIDELAPAMTRTSLLLQTIARDD